MKIYIYIYARMHVYINLLIRQFNWKWVGLKFQLPCWWNWCLALVGRFTGGLSVYVENLMCSSICVYERTTCKWAVLIFILRRICERADVYTCSCLSVYVCRVVIVVSIKDFRKWQHIHDTFAVFVYRKIFPVLTHTYIYIRICDVVREGYVWIIVAKRRCVKITTLSSGIRLLVVASMSTFKC